jgi:hypothetical protein
VKLISLDLGNRTGFGCGDAGAKPRLESWVLKRPGESVDVACRNFACTLRDNIQVENPDIIVAENWLHPSVQPSADTVITQMELHGALNAIAGVYGIRVARPTSAQFRKHFCGQSSAAAPRARGVKRSAKQQAADREATNRMVVKRAIMLGYLPHGSNDWDKASAAGLFDFAVATYARVPPKMLVMFGEQPSEASA